MKRMVAAAITCLGVLGPSQGGDHQLNKMSQAKFKDWQSRWEKNIASSNPRRYCSTEIGEDMGWTMLPFLSGFYYGYLATENPKWIEMLVRCTDSWTKRAVKEPDGYLGWPKLGAGGTDVDNLDNFYADSMLGEAMVLTPVLLMAGKILQTPSLRDNYGGSAEAYLKLSEHVFEKWDARGAWREVESGGMVTVELPFGIDRSTGKWDGYDTRNAAGNGFSHQDNKANLIACWLLAMFDATHKAVYIERAEKWFRTMKSRMHLKADGTYAIWNYWEPAGPWDYESNGQPKHWIGVHPKAGYYEIDVEAIVRAYEHGLIFQEADINQLIATAVEQKRYWTALVPYDVAIQNQFEATADPGSWGGLNRAPWYLALQVHDGAGR
jgi:hypothetical protein